jgi:hypothetical protein
VRLGHRLRDCLFLVCMPWAIASAQVTDSGRVVRIAGDTSGVPPSCRTAAAVAAINNWFRAVETGDTSLIAAAVARRFHWISVSSFTTSESEFAGYHWSDLREYVEQRGRAHETLVLLSVIFTGWRSGALNFGPIHFERSADDLGPKPLQPLQGIGKGAYACGEGLIALSVAPAGGPPR